MIWLHTLYLLGLLVLGMKLQDPSRRRSFRRAWIAFALIPVWQFLMHLFRAGSLRSPHDLAVIEVWNQAVPSLLLGLSFLLLVGALAPNTPSNQSTP